MENCTFKILNEAEKSAHLDVLYPNENTNIEYKLSKFQISNIEYRTTDNSRYLENL